MALIVLKFGGTSVGDLHRIKSSAAIVKKVREDGHKVIIVVSAMAGATNRLISLCHDLSSLDNIDKRYEYDAALASGEALSASLFALSLQEIGVLSRSLQAWQVKIFSNNQPNNALIEDINNELLIQLCDKGVVPVIAGFQAVNSNYQLTTLGRGGSDTTAAAIAAAVKADFCDIYTDVDGVYTCDPRLIHDAKLIKNASYEEILELAGTGAKVLHPRSVEICMRYKIPLRIFSSFTTKSGTTIMSNINETNKITAISYLKKLSIIEIKNFTLPLAEIIEKIANNGINIHQIIRANNKELCFSIHSDYYSKLKLWLKDQDLGEINITEDLGCIVLVGAAIRHDSKLLARILNLVNKNNFNMLQMINSEIKLSLYFKDNEIESCVKILHRELINND